ncbi:MAG: aspartate kinase [Bacteroidia bacterium]|nr:aspartate kinase [Bacteroidia bacterium]
MQELTIHKFGGAALKNATYIRRIAQIIQELPAKNTVIVVSAIDKTTNHLERLARYAKNLDSNQTQRQFKKIKEFHNQIVNELFNEKLYFNTVEKLSVLFKDLEQIIAGVLLLGDFPDRTHDRIMSFGELFSSIIVYEYLAAQQLSITWVDSREIIITDSQIGQSDVIWSLTEKYIQQKISSLLSSGYILTQGYIAANTEGKTTTLGREGSDYSAAIIAASLNARKVIVWKDVLGVLTQDPRFFDSPSLISALSYEQAIEMTYAGASVLHPKTLKPLFQKNIPLQVRSFLDTKNAGTIIGNFPYLHHLPIKLKKTNLAAIQFTIKDFNYLTNKNLLEITANVSELNFTITFIQHQARTLLLCIENRPNDIQKLREQTMDLYDITIWSPVSAITIHNEQTEFSPAQKMIAKQLIDNKLVIVLQEE